MVDEEPFPVFVPLEFLQRMELGNDRDPLLQQVLPSAAEHRPVAGFTADPLTEVARRARRASSRSMQGARCWSRAGSVPFTVATASVDILNTSSSPRDARHGGLRFRNSANGPT